MFEKAKKILEGTFIQPNSILNWNEKDFDVHLRSYRDIKFDHIILQWTEYLDELSGKRYTYYPTALEDKTIRKDLLTNLLK
jgi:hypothetical protein